MALALELAARGRGRVEPNPRVGCVLVRDGKAIGQDFHSVWGGPHAEVNAIRSAEFEHVRRTPGDSRAAAEGATAYVTLEPCSHVGKTGPCTEALIRAGVKTVVAALEDPNPLVRGRGFRRLREAGIEVVVGPGAAGAEQLNRGFLHFHRTGRPYGLAKWAMTLDGKIADPAHRSKWITGERAREHARCLRFECDAILVGVGTVLADDPSLKRVELDDTIDTILKEQPRPRNGMDELYEMEARSRGCTVDEVRKEIEDATRADLPPPRPYRRILLDTHIRTPLTARCVTEAREVETWVVISDAKRNAAVRALTDAGCKVIAMPPDSQGRVDLASLWVELGARGVQQVLIEGGGGVLASAFAAGIVNEVAVYVAPLLLGGRDAVPALGGTGFPLPGAPRLGEIAWERIGDDLCGRGIVVRSAPC